jgi:transcription initiation factor IIE alpha subunit
MGASNIEFTMPGKASKDEIKKAFERQQESDRSCNGHREGYSGDFQTVHKVDFHLDKVFLSYDEAHDYCLNKAEKWETVVAVYYSSAKVESKAIDKMNVQIAELQTKLRGLTATPLQRTKKFHTCGKCKSKVSLKHFHGHACPVCEADLRPDRLLKSIATLQAKMDEAIAKRDAKLKEEKQKLISKATNLKTMVAGWGAC